MAAGQQSTDCNRSITRCQNVTGHRLAAVPGRTSVLQPFATAVRPAAALRIPRMRLRRRLPLQRRRFQFTLDPQCLVWKGRGSVPDSGLPDADRNRSGRRWSGILLKLGSLCVLKTWCTANGSFGGTKLPNMNTSGQRRKETPLLQKPQTGEPQKQGVHVRCLISCRANPLIVTECC